MVLSHVYDTYAKASSGRTMHFNVMLAEQNQSMALYYAKAWLNSIGYPDAVVTDKDCAFSQSATLPTDFKKQIDEKGFAINHLGN